MRLRGCITVGGVGFERQAVVNHGRCERSMKQSSKAIPLSTPAEAKMPLVIVASCVLAVVYGWVFQDWLYAQFRWATEHQADWGHTLVIPLMSAYLVYINRRKLFARPLKTAWTGILPLLLGVAWYMLCMFGPEPLHHHNLRGGGVWLSLVGLVLLFGGWRGMKYMWFPLLFLLIFGQTISDRFMQIVTFKMQDLTAQGSHIVLRLMTLDVERAGNTITLFDGGVPKPLNIAEACSGMRMLMAFLALGVFLAYTGFQRIWQRILLILLAFPTAVFVNILRVVTLALLSLLDTGFAAGDFHSFIGLVWLVPALFIYLGLMWIIRHLVVETQKVQSATEEVSKR